MFWPPAKTSSHKLLYNFRSLLLYSHQKPHLLNHYEASKLKQIISPSPCRFRLLQKLWHSRNEVLSALPYQCLCTWLQNPWMFFSFPFPTNKHDILAINIFQDMWSKAFIIFKDIAIASWTRSSHSCGRRLISWQMLEKETRKNWNLHECRYPLHLPYGGDPTHKKLVQKMESFCKMCRNAKMKILSIKASTFHLISLDIPRIKFIDDTSSNTRAIMTLNYRLAKVCVS